MKNRLLILILITSSVIAAFILYPTLTQAQEAIPIGIANSKNELLLDPGESQRVTLKIFNNGTGPIIGKLSTADVIVNDNDGTPIFLERGESKQLANKFSLATWIALPFNQIAIAPNDKTVFDVTVSVPTDAKPGGRYGAVIFEAIPPQISNSETTDQEGQALITPRIASLFYVTVSGTPLEQALINNLRVPGFSEYGPIKVMAEIANRGDIHITPKGLFTVSDWFGRNVFQTKMEEVNIFPEVSRNFEAMIGETLMIGRYKLHLSASYGNQGKLVEGYKYFWVIPWRIILAIALTLSILLIIIKNYRKKVIIHQKDLEKKLAEEQQEIDKLKEELKGRS